MKITMVDASRIARHQTGGGSIAFHLDHRPPAPLRNHSRDNIRALREKERQMRGKKLMESHSQPPREFKLKQFEAVKSRVLEDKPQRPRSGRPPTGRPIRSSSVRPARDDVEQEDGDDGEGEMNLEEFEREAERLKRLHGKTSGKRTPPSFDCDGQGKPRYLQKIKADIAHEKEVVEALLAKPSLPSGYRQLPDEEICETLEVLQKKRAELDKEFQRLPLNVVTDSQKRREKAIVDKINECDKAIKTFSQPKVLVAC